MLQRQLADIPEAVIFPFNIPTISGLRRVGRLQLPAAGPERHADRATSSATRPAQFLDAARKRPELANLFTSFDPRYPQVKVELDREKARTLGVPINEVFQAMSAVHGRQPTSTTSTASAGCSASTSRPRPTTAASPKTSARSTCAASTTNDDDPALHAGDDHVRSAGTEITARFNLFRSVEINGVPGRGYTSGQALAALEDVFKQTMPKEMGFAYSQSLLPGKGRAAGGTDLRPGDRVRVPAAGRDVRELAPAVGGAARLAAGRAWAPSSASG